MKHKSASFILAAICLFLAFSHPGYCNEKPTCAVLLFYPDAASSQSGESQHVSAQYADLLSRLGLFEVMDYKTVSRILEKKNILNIDQACASKECALNIGQLLNVDYTIYGVIGHIGNLSSLETGIVNITGGNEAQHASTDFEGSQEKFADTAPSENIKSLFGVTHIPEKQAAKEEKKIKQPGTAPQEDKKMETLPEAAQSTEKEKNLYIGPRIGIGASNDGIKLGGGFEVQYTHLSFQFLLNGDGFASGLSYYLNQKGNSPFLSAVGAYYDTENHGVDEIGRIYGLLLGYRLNIIKHLNARLGLGAGYINWDQTEFNRAGTKDGDEEIIPLFEVSFGYMF
ncbi:MAG: hypothetical protein M0Z56_03895 [Desulfobacteraceae bacterium]|nr:hypothetical protein [Desulfobacteraceae bacterium]